MITVTVTTTQRPLGKETCWSWTAQGRAHMRVFTGDSSATDEVEARLCREIGGGDLVRVYAGGATAILRDGNGYQEWVRA